ncbi:hypothetical protein [Candidatus Entotheonella palauensis]|uniref:Uncharacterized protein n=1 Tax=Candidatus Entotheonella gemina TaxID=1429439 RepID=W4MDY0_9BACT|nr:hypothetical protein [Candidatus Entotheonella palauensis]ETX08385.1 MAG: hypothetical protein ETSY2_05740 [Candidatus Entotheonella gemina]
MSSEQTPPEQPEVDRGTKEQQKQPDHAIQQNRTPAFLSWFSGLLKDYGAVMAILAIGIPVIIEIGALRAQVTTIPELRADIIDTHKRVLPEIRNLIRDNKIAVEKFHITVSEIKHKLDEVKNEIKDELNALSSNLEANLRTNSATLLKIETTLAQQAERIASQDRFVEMFLKDFISRQEKK